MADSARLRGWKWDAANDQLEVWHDGLKVLSFTATATDAPKIIPAVDDYLSLGNSTYQFKDIYIDGSAYIDGIAEDTLVATNKKIQFRDTGIFLQSTADGLLKISADHTTSAAAINLADAVTCNDHVTIAAGKILYLRDTGISLQSTANGLLKISADHSTSAAAINMADPVTFSDHVTMADGKKLYIRGTGAVLASTAAGVITLACTGAGAGDFTINCTTSLADNVTMTTTKEIRTATGDNKDYNLAAGSGTGTAFGDVITIRSATVLANRELGFFGGTNCVAQQAHCADGTFAGASKFNALLVALENYGLLATA